MRPAKYKRNNRIFAWAAIATSFAILLSVGNTQSRMIEWASQELIVTPAVPDGYSSDCLIQNGQSIVLSDWTAEQTQRVIQIAVSRPVPEPTEPELPKETETSAAATEPSETLEQEPTEEPVYDEPDEQAATEATEPMWSAEELTVTMDEETQKHLRYAVVVQEHEIQLTLERLEDAPGLAQATQLTILLQWQGLEGTVCVNMLPYGDLEEIPQEDSVPEREIDDTLTAVKVCDTIAPGKPTVCVKLNLETRSDFRILLSQGRTPLTMVRWSRDGENYALLYDSAEISIAYPYPQDWDGTLFLDFSVSLKEQAEPTIAVEATGYGREEFKPRYQAIPEPTQQVVKASQMPAILAVNTRWGAAQLQVESVERLMTDEEGNLTYQLDETLSTTVLTDGVAIQSILEGTIPASGSYRMTVQWIWNDVCIEKQIFYFFINTN